jgi:hypothetical protein
MSEDRKSGQHKPQEVDVRVFALQQAANLAKPIEELCGQVIAKGMTGILEAACELQQQRNDLVTVLARLVCNPGNPDYQAAARAAIAKATGSDA